MYELPDVDKPCFECKYRDYDSFHDKLYCMHDPKPQGLGDYRLINGMGTCEYWEGY